MSEHRVSERSPRMNTAGGECHKAASIAVRPPTAQHCFWSKSGSSLIRLTLISSKKFFASVRSMGHHDSVQPLGGGAAAAVQRSLRH